MAFLVLDLTVVEKIIGQIYNAASSKVVSSLKQRGNSPIIIFQIMSVMPMKVRPISK